jgi:hypothetical protein
LKAYHAWHPHTGDGHARWITAHLASSGIKLPIQGLDKRSAELPASVLAQVEMSLKKLREDESKSPSSPSTGGSSGR